MNAFEMTLLFDTYGTMLTKKQWEYLDMRYNQDMSLSEIAQEKGVSRQAVFDNLNRAEAQLQKMEENIGCVRRDRTIDDAINRIEGALERLSACGSDTAAQAVGDIRTALDLLRE